MIPIIRSLSELNLIKRSEDKVNNISEKKEFTRNSIRFDNKEKNKEVKINRLVNLPFIPKSQRKKWTKSKEKLSKFFDELDYNNQIQSTYDLTLLERQCNPNEHDAA